MKRMCGSFEYGTESNMSVTACLPKTIVSSPNFHLSAPRARINVGSGLPIRYTSPLGNAATPSVELRPRPPASSGASVRVAPSQRPSSALRSMTTDVADSAAAFRLFFPL